MQTSKVIVGTRTYTDYQAVRPMHVQPVITGTFRDPDGIRMYRGENGREFIADIFDRTWRVTPGLVKPLRYKGKNPSGKVEGMK
jgi:hypothetical protein